MTSLTPIILVTFDASGLIPVVAQDEASGDVLLQAYMNEEALRRTLAERVLVLWSRSRGQLWRKGERSGHTLRLMELRVNCEGNSLLARVRLDGLGACHDGYRSCYYRRIETGEDGALRAAAVEERVFDPGAVYGVASVPASYVAPDERSLLAAFERDARALYAAYERLRDSDETANSSTSRLLRQSDREASARYALSRAEEELAELRGVIAGTHRHRGGVDDVILEASQTGYWTLLAAIALHIEYDAWKPHDAWLAGYYDRPLRAPDGHADDDPLARCAALLRAAGALCRLGGAHPGQVIAADLAEMRQRHSPD